jgi:2-oxoglutarate ferredoxin oxidoreductase subunit delta
MATRPYIDCNKCKQHFVCVNVCPSNVFDKVGEKECPKVARPQECIGCRACEVNCPETAIEVSETEPAWFKTAAKPKTKKK